MGQSVIDYETLAVLDELFGNNLYLSDLFPPYKDQIEATQKSLKVAIGEQDGRAVIFHSHSLKSSSAQLGAVRVSTMCQSLENYGHTLDWPAIAIAFAELRMEAEAAVIELSILEMERRKKAV